MSDTDRPEAPKPPEHLNNAAAKLWRETLAEFDLGTHELEVLRLACEALTRADQARKALRRHGLLWEDRLGNLRPRPEVDIEHKARASFAQLIRQLALPEDEDETPAQLYGRPRRGRAGTFAPRKAS